MRFGYLRYASCVNAIALVKPSGSVRSTKQDCALGFRIQNGRISSIYTSRTGELKCTRSPFRNLGFRANVTAMVTGKAKSHRCVPAKSLLACNVLTVKPMLFTLFDRTGIPMMNRAVLNRRESHEMAWTRDLLLPKLMSGEIRLRDAEKEGRQWRDISWW